MRIARSSSHDGGSPHPPPLSRHPPFQSRHPQSRHPPEQTPPTPQPPWSRHPPGQIPLNFPLGCEPGPDPPKLPPWLWAWTRSPSNSPLGVGLKTCKACWDTTPLETCCKACWDTTCNACWDSTPPLPLWTEFLTHASENITLPQTSFGGGKYDFIGYGYEILLCKSSNKNQ